MNESLIPKHGGYRELVSFQKAHGNQGHYTNSARPLDRQTVGR